MAFKAEVSFKVFSGGFREYSVRKATTINTWQELKDKVVEQVKKEYPEVVDATIIRDDQYPQLGYGEIIAQHGQTYFKLEVNRIP